MKRRRFLQMFSLSPAAVVLPVPAAVSVTEIRHIEPAADAPIWSMATATCMVYLPPHRSVYCRDQYGTNPCKQGAENCVCQQRMLGKEYVT